MRADAPRTAGRRVVRFKRSEEQGRSRSEKDTTAPVTHLLLTVEQASSALNISRTRVFELLRDGRLTGVKLGRTTRIRATDLDSFVSSLVAQPSRPAQARGRRT